MDKDKKNLVLAFETSCDETCAAVVDKDLNTLSNVISTQIEIHKLYGGVVPEIASRNHAMAIQTVYEEALAQAGVTLSEITKIAATGYPGLRGAVMIGKVFGESLATACKIPFFEINHLAGHIASVTLSHRDLPPPFLSLLVSGGHTSLYKVSAWDDIVLLCETSDDACGEAFDKVAKLLGLGYPGGIQIETQAKNFNGDKDLITFVSKPSKKDGFSYSGLKTAVSTYLQKSKNAGDPDLPFVCASFQHEAIGQLVAKCVSELKKLDYKTLCICGGVSANKHLRESMTKACNEIGVKVFFPEFQFCTDNAAMIAAATVLGSKL